MKKFFLILVICIACKKGAQTPPGILPPPTMVNLLVQIHIAEAKASVKNLPPDSSNKYFNYLKNQVFASFKTDSIAFKKSYKYYASDTKKMDAIYTSVVDSLSLKESRKVLQ